MATVNESAPPTPSSSASGGGGGGGGNGEGGSGGGATAPELTLSDSSGRVKGVTIVKPIVVGNVAKYFGEKRVEDGHTHEWRVYVKPYLNEDYSRFIKKVHFKLHESYANPNRMVTRPPYEIQETGWGEFEVTIKIHFNDPFERPVTLHHHLKLFQAGTGPHCPGSVIQEHLLSESYDEIVFQEPTVLMKSLLDGLNPITDGEWTHDTDFEVLKKETSERVQESKQRVRAEIDALRDQLALARQTIHTFKTALTDAQKNAEAEGQKKSGPEGKKKSGPEGKNQSGVEEQGIEDQNKSGGEGPKKSGNERQKKSGGNGKGKNKKSGSLSKEPVAGTSKSAAI